jgi:hypothetical protein
MPPSGLAIKYQEHARVAHAISCRRGQKASLQGSVEAPSNSNNLLDQNWTKWFQEKPENSGHFGRCYCPNKAKSLSWREKNK